MKNMVIFFMKVRKSFKFESLKKIVKIPFQDILKRPSNKFWELFLDDFCTFDLKNNRFVLNQNLFETKPTAIINSFDLSYRDQQLIDNLKNRNNNLIYNKIIYFPENLFYLKENCLLELNDHIKEFACSVNLTEIWVNTDEGTIAGLQEKTQFHLKLFIELFNSILDRGSSKNKKNTSVKKVTKIIKKFANKTLKRNVSAKNNSEEKTATKGFTKEQITPELSRLAKYILILGNIARSHSLQMSSLFYFVQKLKPVLPESLWKLCDTIIEDNGNDTKGQGHKSEKIIVESPKSKTSNRFAKLMKKIKKKKKKNYKQTEKIVEEKTGIKIADTVPGTCGRKNSTTSDVCISCQNGFEKDEEVFFLVRQHKYDVHKLLLFQNYWNLKEDLINKKHSNPFLFKLWNGYKVSIPTTCNHPYHLKCIKKTLQNKKPVCLLCKMKSHVYMNRKLLKPSEIKGKDENEKNQEDNDNSSANSEISKNNLDSSMRIEQFTEHFLGPNLNGSALLNMMENFTNKRSRDKNPKSKIEIFDHIFERLMKIPQISKKEGVDLENKSFGIQLYQKLMMPVEMIAKMTSIWCPDNFVRKIFPCLSQYFYILFSLKNLSEFAFMEFSMVCNDIKELFNKFVDELKNNSFVYYTEMITREIGLSSMEVLYLKYFLASFWSSVSGLPEIKCIENNIEPIFNEINQSILPKIILIKLFQGEREGFNLTELNNDMIISRCTNILKILMILDHLIFQKELSLTKMDSPDVLNGSAIRNLFKLIFKNTSLRITFYNK
jgi:hypothetical protein